jgi:hypothetical protein
MIVRGLLVERAVLEPLIGFSGVVKRRKSGQPLYLDLRQATIGNRSEAIFKRRLAEK